MDNATNHPFYTEADLAKIIKNALLWADILVQTPQKRLEENIRKRISSMMPATEEHFWSQRITMTLSEMGALIRQLKREHRVLFVLSCMTGCWDVLQKILPKRSLPTFIELMPGVCGLERNGSIRFNAKRAASEQIIYLLMPVAQPERVLSAAGNARKQPQWRH